VDSWATKGVDLIGEFRTVKFMIIDKETKVCGIIGYPLEHTLSPAIHNAAAQYHKLNVVFLAFPTLDPKGAIAGMRALGWRELTITMPYKEKVIPYLDELDSVAAALGNVNTIINEKGKLKGYNTDITGIELSLADVRLKGKTVVLLGAGGVSNTVAFAIKKKGGSLHIFNREQRSAQLLAKRFGASSWSNLDNLDQKVLERRPYLIINATPVGMGKLRGQSLLAKKTVASAKVVFDLIYNPTATKLLKDAQAAGCRVINGRTMFLGQGARQFELWSGRPAPMPLLAKVFDASIKARR